MKTIIGIKLDNRSECAVEFQQILSDFGCGIRTRIGLHDTHTDYCTNFGIVLLEIVDESAQKNESAYISFQECKMLYKLLGKFKKVILNEYPGSSNYKREFLDEVDSIKTLLKDMWDGQRLESTQINKDQEKTVSENVPDKNVYVDVHIQGRAKILSDGGYSHEVNGKYCYDVELEDGRKMQVFKSEIKSNTEIDVNYDEVYGSKKESAMEDAYEYLIEYADNEGLNVSDLIDYDPEEIAEWISDRMGREVTAEEIEKLIQEEAGTDYDEIFGSKEESRDSDTLRPSLSAYSIRYS